MFCTKCGNAVSDTAKFCPVCGTPVDRGIYADEMREIIATPEVPADTVTEPETVAAEPVPQEEPAPQPEAPVAQAEPVSQEEALVAQEEPAPREEAPVAQEEPVSQAEAPVAQEVPAPQAAEPVMQDVPDITLTAQKWLPEEGEQIPPTPTEAAPAKKSKKGLIITLCAIVAVLGLAVGAAFFISGKYSDKVDELEA